MRKEEELKNKICEIGRRMYERRMVVANAGNISMRLNEHEFLCTPTGVSKGLMKPEFICKVDAKGELLWANQGFRPSSEMKMHMRVYEKRPDIGAIVHAHPVFATSFAVAGIPLERPIMAEVILTLGRVPIVPYGTPSTKEIPDALEAYLTDFTGVLLENHGALTWAEDGEAAYQKMESLEFYAEILYRTKILGGAKELSQEQITKLLATKKERDKIDGCFFR